MVKEFVPSEVRAVFSMATEALHAFEFMMAWGFGFAGLTEGEMVAVEGAHADAKKIVFDLLAAYRRCELTPDELSVRLHVVTDPATLFEHAGIHSAQ